MKKELFKWREVCFLIPAYNESSVIEDVLKEVTDLGATAVVVDDASTDETYKTASSNKKAIVLRHTINTGQGGALNTASYYALRYTDAEYFVTFDSDGQHQINDVKKMIKAIKNNNIDVALGTRFGSVVAENMKFSKLILLKLAIIYTKITSKLEVTDTHNGLRVFTRKGLSAIKITRFGMAHASEILNQISINKLKYTEVPIKIIYTDYSMSKGQASINSINILFDMILKGDA